MKRSARSGKIILCGSIFRLRIRRSGPSTYSMREWRLRPKRITVSSSREQMRECVWIGIKGKGKEAIYSKKLSNFVLFLFKE